MHLNKPQGKKNQPNFPRCSQNSFEPSAALIFLISMAKMQAAASFLHICLPLSKLLEDNIPSVTQCSRWFSWKWNHFNNFIFLFSTEENTWLDFIHTIHNGKEANHPNFRDSKFQTIRESNHCYAEWGVSIHMQIYKWKFYYFFFQVILSTADS